MREKTKRQLSIIPESQYSQLSYTLSVNVGIETFSFLRLSSKKQGQTESVRHNRLVH